MKTSNSILEISKALLKAQKEIGGAMKDSDNPFFKSKYADFNSVMRACKEELNKNGITVLQPLDADENGDYVVTTLLHESGEYISSRMRLHATKQDMQAYGSAVTYARRYSLQSLVFIAAEDDDGEATMQRDTPPRATAAPAKAPMAVQSNAQYPRYTYWSKDIKCLGHGFKTSKTGAMYFGSEDNTLKFPFLTTMSERK